MTFSLRKKRRTIPHAAPARQARTIISVIAGLLVCTACVRGQGPSVAAVNPQFLPTPPNHAIPAPTVGPALQRSQTVVQAFQFQKPPAQPDFPGLADIMQLTQFREIDAELLVRTELPGPQRLFIRESEEEFFERIAKELKKTSGPGQFFRPEEPIVSKDPYVPRYFPCMTTVVEPSYVCHRRLLFEQPNFERIGWNLGAVQPAINLGVFYYDMAMLPYHVCSDLCDRGDCSAGKCLPGDPAPLLLYHERLSVTGLIGEVGVLSGLFFLFP